MRLPTKPAGLARRATVFLIAVVAAAGGAAVAAATGFGGGEPWATFAVLALGAGAAQLLVVPTGRNHGFQTASVFIVAAALLLPPQLVALMGVAQHGPEGLRKRYPWYIQAFNIANGTLNALAAWGAAEVVGRLTGLGGGASWALAGLAAGAAFILVNHLLLAVMLLLARGHSIAASGLFSAASLALELVPAGLGVALAALWQTNRWLVPAAIAPLLLSHRTFAILAQLRESEERFRAMFESAAVGAGLIDLEGRLVSSNRALEAMLGLSKPELAGLRLSEVTHPEDREASEVALAELSAGTREEFHGERRYLGRDGEVVWGNTAMAHVRDADGRPRYAIAMIEDATKRKALELELQHSQKMEAIGRLAGGVAHDFNNMLTAITGYTEMSLCRLDAGLSIPRSDLEEVRKAADRSATLTRQLLAFSRKQVLQPQVVYVNDVVADVEPMLRRLIGEHVEIEARLGAQVGRIRADEAQLQQVLLNLVVNARDAMPDGGRLVIATGDADPGDDARPPAELAPGDYVTLSVADDGCGMASETLERIFEPFFTTKRIGEGTGLGLSMVYGIVTQSGGAIDVQSEVGRGTTFRIWFPRVDEALGAPSESVSADDADGAETVLLVEDEEAVRTMLRDFLRGAGYTVLEARDGVHALRLRDLHRGGIDVMVTDVVMPEMSGIELAQRMREADGDVPILFISGYTGGSLLPGGLAEDARLLQKPFPPQTLARKLREILDERSPELAA